MNRMRVFKVSSLCVLTALIGIGCSNKEEQQQAAGPQAVPVVAVEVVAETIPADYTTVAQTEGSLEVEVRAQVSGIMENFNFQEGGMVKKGQQLFQIDPRPFQNELQQAKANLASAQAVLLQANRNFDRIKPLYGENAVSKKEYDDTLATVETAQASVQVAQAAVSNAQLNLEYTKVKAPITGVVSKSIPSRGTLVTAQQTLLTKISQIDPMYVNFSYSDQAYAKLTRDINAGRVVAPADGKLRVRLTMPDKTAYAETGVINFQDVSVDTGTSTIQMRATIPNPSRALRPGQFVEATVLGLVRPNAVAIPQRAVQEGENGKFVYVINAQNVAEIRPVKEGDWYKDLWVIDEGLQAGEKVIVDGLIRVRPGAPVAARMLNEAVEEKTTTTTITTETRQMTETRTEVDGD